MKEPPLPKRQKRKLTWVEVLSLVALCAYLALVVPMYIWPPPTVSSKTTARNNLKQVSTSLLIYSSCHDDVYPAAQSMPTFRAVLMPYLRNREFLLSRDHKQPFGTYNFSLSGVFKSIIGQPESVPTLLATSAQCYSDLNHRSFLIVANVDGSVAFHKYEEWDDITECFHLQFPRAAKAFFPPDYLADKDPILKLKAK